MKTIQTLITTVCILTTPLVFAQETPKSNPYDGSATDEGGTESQPIIIVSPTAYRSVDD